MRKQKRQYDPVAASAIAALNSTQRTGRALRQQLQAPEPPGAEMAFNQSRSVLQQVSSLSPLNVLGEGRAPQLPGMQAQGGPLPGLPAPQQVMGGGLPMPQDVLGGGMSQGRRQKANANDTNGAGQGGTGGGSAQEQSGSGGKTQEESRS